MYMYIVYICCYVRVSKYFPCYILLFFLSLFHSFFLSFFHSHSLTHSLLGSADCAHIHVQVTYTTQQSLRTSTIDFCYNYTAYLEYNCSVIQMISFKRDPLRRFLFLHMCVCVFSCCSCVVGIIVLSLMQLLLIFRRIYIVQFTHRTIHTYRCPRQPEKVSCHFIDQHFGLHRQVGPLHLRFLHLHIVSPLTLPPKICTQREESRNVRCISFRLLQLEFSKSMVSFVLISNHIIFIFSILCRFNCQPMRCLKFYFFFKEGYVIIGC